MAKFRLELFPDYRLRYSYNKPFFAVKAQVNNALSKSGGFFDERDYVGVAWESGFSLRIISTADTRGVPYGSTLAGEIIEIGANRTNIEIRFRTSIVLKVIAVILVLLGIAYLVQSIAQKSMEFLLWALAMIIIGPLACNWFAGISNASLQSRYERFIHKPLKLEDKKL